MFAQNTAGGFAPDDVGCDALFTQNVHHGFIFIPFISFAYIIARFPNFVNVTVESAWRPMIQDTNRIIGNIFLFFRNSLAYALHLCTGENGKLPFFHVFLLDFSKFIDYYLE